MELIITSIVSGAISLCFYHFYEKERKRRLLKDHQLSEDDLKLLLISTHHKLEILIKSLTDIDESIKDAN